MRRLVLAAALLASAAFPAASHAYEYKGADFTEAYLESGDGTLLHADVLRPKGLPEDAKTPVILSAGPYFNHAGQVGALGPVQDAGYEPGRPGGPSERFADFIEGAKLFERGYSFVMVDLRSYGGSAGCLDWVGPGEQADVKAAVEWAASQPWSTGSVGMYGKSYDAVTGLVGAVSNPKGLKAVVSMEPVYDMYRYLYSNGVRYANSAGTPALYDAIAVTPGPLLDNPMYNLNGATDPACLASNYASQQDADPDSAYWKQRDLIAKAPNAKVPLFLTQGFLENNTKPDGTWDFYNALDVPKRAWFGMFDHVRGNETVGGDGEDRDRLKIGRAGWFDETMRFFDHYVRGVPLADAATDKDPPQAVQTSDGTWRAETSWPPADSEGLKVELTPGVYAGDGQNNGTGGGAGNGLWTISPPLESDAWYAGVPKAELQLAPTSSQVVVDVYDIDQKRMATLLSREASLVPADGRLSLKLLGNDWKIPAGHRIGVLVTDTNAEWWLPSTPSTLTLTSGSIELPFLKYKRPDTIQGDRSVRLEEWLEEAPFEVPEDVIASSTTASFARPKALVDAPAGALPAPGSSNPTMVGGNGAGATPNATARKRLRARIGRRGKRRLIIYGDAPAGTKVRVLVKRRGRTVRRRTVKTRVNAFRVRVRVRRPGRYRAVVRVKVDGQVLRARTRRVRVRQ